MFVAIDTVRRTVRCGIIDYVQQYTIDKQLESIVKQTINGEEPTIINPELYKSRFRSAMDKYFVAMIPDQDTNLQTIVSNFFNSDKIQWFTK